MTIGIGFTCGDGSVIMATDSQMSWTSYKQSGYQKIVRIPFVGNNSTALLKAGNWEWANAFHEDFLARASVTSVNSEHAIRDCAAESLKAVRQKIQDGYYHANQPPGAAAEHLNSRPTEFILAYVFNNTPRFYTMDLVAAMPSRVFHKFSAIGLGSEIASFILNDLDLQNCDLDEALCAAVYTVEACCRHAQGCGGPPLYNAVKPDGSWLHFSDIGGDLYVKAAARVHEALVKDLPALIKHAMKDPD